MDSNPRRIVILAEGYLDFHHGKTAVSILRYSPKDVVAVIDSQNAGSTTDDVLRVGGATPIFASVEDTAQFKPTQLLIGIAPRGGGLSDEWRHQILSAIDMGMDVVSGLHTMLNDDRELVVAAGRRGVRLLDVRKPPDGLGTAELAPRRPGSRVLTFVGSDCAVGKMTAALEMYSAARAANLSAAFVATGQTGIMIEGSGIAIDRVIGDFMAGAAEQLVLSALDKADWVFVEGQGSLLHPAYSGVTLALLHGSSPDALVLVHQMGHDVIDEYPVRIPPIEDVVRMYEEAAAWVKPAPVVAVALNTRELSEKEARDAISDVAARTGLPADDPVRFGAERLVDAVVNKMGGGVEAQTAFQAAH